MSLVIKNGLAFLGDKFQKKDILIEDGIISAIGVDLKGSERIDATDMLVLPGLIDPHVHLRDPGLTQKEDMRTGTEAAVAGGFTTIMDMPNNKPPTITEAALAEKREIAKRKAVCDVLFHFGATEDNHDEVAKADPGSLKLYLGTTTGNMAVSDWDAIERHFASFPKDRPIVMHASDHAPDETFNLERTFQTEERAIELAKRHKRKVHLAHASAKKEVLISKRCDGCTCEVAPHHLFLSKNDEAKLGYYAKVYPPLRSEQKRLMLWSALERIDCIATDHAPHTPEDKENGAAGFPGLETSLSLMLLGCQRGLADRIGIFQKMSQNPADIFNLPRKGRIRKGLDGDITILDPKKEWTVQAHLMHSKCGWSPYEGMRLKGKAHTVIRAGKPIYREFKLC